MKLLIVNADDFGMSPEVNAAILRAHREGIVSSTTAMANGPAAADLPQLRGLELGVGLHCNVTHGRPLTKASTLVDERGEFWGPLELMRRHAELDPADLRAELEAQRDRFEALYKSPPDHLDVHQYSLCFFAAGLEAMRTVAAGLPTRNYRSFLEPLSFQALVERIQRGHKLTLPPLQPVVLPGPHPPTTDHWEHRLDRNCTPEQVLAFLAEYTGTVELMCHPGAGEVELLTSPALQTLRGGTFAEL